MLLDDILERIYREQEQYEQPSIAASALLIAPGAIEVDVTPKTVELSQRRGSTPVGIGYEPVMVVRCERALCVLLRRPWPGGG